MCPPPADIAFALRGSRGIVLVGVVVGGGLEVVGGGGSVVVVDEVVVVLEVVVDGGASVVVGGGSVVVDEVDGRATSDWIVVVTAGLASGSVGAGACDVVGWIEAMAVEAGAGASAVDAVTGSAVVEGGEVSAVSADSSLWSQAARRLPTRVRAMAKKKVLGGGEMFESHILVSITHFVVTDCGFPRFIQTLLEKRIYHWFKLQDLGLTGFASRPL